MDQQEDIDGPAPPVFDGQGQSSLLQPDNSQGIDVDQVPEAMPDSNLNNITTEPCDDLKIDDLSIENGDEESDEAENAYPDTVLKMQYTNVIHDSEMPTPDGGNKTRLSAKQRRDLRKMKKKAQHYEDISEHPVEAEHQIRNMSAKIHHKKVNKENKGKHDVAPQPKRGQKKKLQKIKDKYGDQDEEDREMMMQILQSANAPKDKKGKKGKKARAKMEAQAKNNASRQQRAAAEESRRKDGGEGVKSEKTDLNPNDNVVVSTLSKLHQSNHVKTSSGETNAPLQVADKAAVVNENQEDINSDDEREMLLKAEHLDIEVENIVDSLTGSPHSDDIIMFAIPVCAPYNAMQNYKFKVKMTPGSSKKGRATKTALGMFQAQTDTNQQEKDHFRSVKDYDLARNLPGKVKLSAPNLSKQHQQRKKRR